MKRSTSDANGQARSVAAADSHRTGERWKWWSTCRYSTRCHRDPRVCLRRCSLDKQRSTALLPAGRVCTFFRSNFGAGLCRIAQIAFLIFQTALGCAASTTLNNYIRKRFRLHRQRDPEAST